MYLFHKDMIRLIMVFPLFILLSCNTDNQNNNLFDDLVGKTDVAIFLNTFQIDSVPSEIGQLIGVRRLYIASDSITGWTVYPPFNAMSERINTPPFRHVPDEITTLTSLETLVLNDLDLVSLPDDFGNLKNLDSLSLFLNKLIISNEMEKLKQLKNLKYIGLFGNRVDSLDVHELQRSIPGIFVQWRVGDE